MNRKRFKQIESLAINILETQKILTPPINIQKAAQLVGLQVIGYDFNDDVSGVLVIEGDKKTIGYNKNNAEVRRRFTIAHELGHYVLGHQRGGLFVDNANRSFSILFRDEKSSTGEILQEREANAFAAAILMPESVLKEEMSKFSFDLSDDKDIVVTLSKQFKVSTQAMAFRLSNLGLLDENYL